MTPTSPTAGARASRSPSDVRLIDELREALLAAVRGALGGAQVVDLVDYPDHYNVGDAALWLGERAALRALGVRVASVTTRSTYDPRRLRADGPIVILPGGNLGGLYATHHQLKLSVLADFPGRPVIQLPQSLRYAGETQREELRRAVDQHGATTLILRDRPSYEIAQRDFDCEVVLAPDMALALGPLRAGHPRRPFVVQARTDKESAGPIARHDVATVDWLEASRVEPVAAFSVAHRLVSRASAASDMGATRAALLAASDGFARANLRRGIGMLSLGERVLTDRLHGHILAALLGIEHIVVNDQFGKIESMWNTWTSRFDCATFEPTWEGAWRRLAGIETLSAASGEPRA